MSGSGPVVGRWGILALIMFAKGVQGTKAEDSAKWAAGELGKIYG